MRVCVFFRDFVLGCRDPSEIDFQAKPNEMQTNKHAPRSHCIAKTPIKSKFIHEFQTMKFWIMSQFNDYILFLLLIMLLPLLVLLLLFLVYFGIDKKKLLLFFL